MTNPVGHIHVDALAAGMSGRPLRITRCCSAGLRHGLGVLVLVAVLAGCAGPRIYGEGQALFAEGKTEEGLAKLEEAVKLDPDNVEYRIALGSRRASEVNRLIAAAETARRSGSLGDAEKAYRQVQRLDVDNIMARQGLEALVMERRHRQAVAQAEELFKQGGEAGLESAMETLHPVLAQDPERRDALNLKARIDEKRANATRAETELAASFRKPITLEFRDAPLKSVFDVIAQVSGLNFFFDRDIRPDLKITVMARNTSIEDAVRLLLLTNQLEQKVLNDNSILIYPNTPQKLKNYQTLTVRSFFLANADVKAVSNSIKTLVKAKDLVIDERLGIIMMRDTPEAIRMAERIVALQDLADPEVMLDVEVLEIKRTRLLDLGIQWPGQLTLAPLSGAGAGAQITLEDLKNLSASTTQAGIGSVVMNARKEDQDANILANPRIRVRNKDKAKILIGDRVPVITTTSTSTGFVSESVSYVDVGLKLEVEPNIHLDEEVAIKVNLEVSSLVREVLSKSGTLSYQIGTRGASTVLRLKDGETQILAGLISDEDRSTANKVPGIGEMPVLGRLFGSQKDDTARSEILLSITPRLVRTIRRPDLFAAEFESGTETNIGAAPLRLTTFKPETSGEAAAAKPGEASGQAMASPHTPTVTPPMAAHGSAPGAELTPVPSASVSPSPASSPSAAAAALSFDWQAPAQVKVGEQFSAVLRVGSQAALRGLPLLVGFDPQALQVVSVQEGDFFRQAGASTNFSQRVDPVQGKVFVAAVRQNPAGSGGGINGTGSVFTVTFKALKVAKAKLQLLSVSPEPAPAMPVAVPVGHVVNVVSIGG